MSQLLHTTTIPRWNVTRAVVAVCLMGVFPLRTHAQAPPAPDYEALSARLAVLERELAELRQALTTASGRTASGPGAASTPSVDPRAPVAIGATAVQLESLDQQIRILDRRVERERDRATETAKVTAAVEAGRSGFALKSPDGAFNLRLRGIVQADSRWYLEDDANAAADTFVMRRVRPIVQATLFRMVDFRVTPDFGDGRTVIQDAYLDLRLTPLLRVRGGKFKSPFGLERLASASDLRFLERAFPTGIAPNRDIGVMLYGDSAGSVLSYAAGVFNGVVDGGSADADDQDGKEIVGRVFVQPLARSATHDRLHGLGFGVAASYGMATGAALAPNLPVYRTTAQQIFFRYRTDAAADGRRVRLSPQAYYYAGRLGLFFEQASSWQEVRRGTTAQDEVPASAVQFAGSWVLTGERATYRGVIPRRSFEPAAGGWGAFEITARYHQLTVGDEAFPLLADPSTAARSARAWTAGLNWYLNPSFKIATDIEETRFDGGGTAGADRQTARDFLTRFQVSF